MNRIEVYELNKQVAEALGFRFEIHDNSLVVATPYPSETWEAERYGSFVAIPNDGYLFQRGDVGLHNWAGDVNEALELAFDSNIHIVLRKWNDAYNAEMRWFERGVEYGYSRDGDTPAEAVCRAWLAYKDETKE